MKNLFYCLVLFASILCFSCNNKSDSKSDTDIKTENVPSDKYSNEEELTFKNFEASGSEPGWNLQTRSKADTIIYELNLNYNDLTYKGEANFNKEDNNLSLKTDDGIITIPLKNEECLDLAGNPHEISIDFSFNGTRYIGCGDYK